jgi:hypothetical protein
MDTDFSTRTTRNTRKEKMHTKLELNSKQKRVINAISKRLAQQQAASLKTERECLTKFTEVVGYDSPAEARQYVLELLQQDENGHPTFLFDKAEWSKSLTRIALEQLKEKEIERIEARLDKLSV